MMRSDPDDPECKIISQCLFRRFKLGVLSLKMKAALPFFNDCYSYLLTRKNHDVDSRSKER